MSASHARSWQYPLSVFGGFFALWVLVMTSPAYAPHQSHLFVPSQALHPTRSLPAAPHVPSLSHKEAARSSSRLLGPNPSESQPAATRQSALHGPDSAAHAAPAYQPQSLWVGNALVACGFLGFATYVSRRRRLRASGLPQESTPCLGPDCRPPLALRANPDKALVVDPEAELETGTTTSEPTSPTQTPPGSPSPEATRYPKERLFIFNPPKGSTKGFTKGSAKASTPTSRAQELQERIYAFSPQEALEHPPDAPPPSRRADILGKIAAYGFTALSVVALALNLQWHPHLYGLYLVGWVAAATTIFHNRSAYTRRISPELLCFLATSVWASLGFAAGIPVEVDLAFDYFLPGSLALSLLLQAPAPKAPEKPNPKPPKPSKAKPVGLVSSRVKKLKPTPPAKKEGNRLTPMFAALCFGAVGTISGSLLTAFGMQFLGLNVPGHLVALSMGCLTASYIGGTANFFETVRMINPDPEGLQYVTVLAGGDVAVMGLYFFVLRLIHQFSPETYVHHDTQGKEHIVATNPRTVCAGWRRLSRWSSVVVAGGGLVADGVGRSAAGRGGARRGGAAGTFFQNLTNVPAENH